MITMGKRFGSTCWRRQSGPNEQEKTRDFDLPCHRGFHFSVGLVQPLRWRAKHEFRLVIHEVENRKINKVPDFQETRNIATSAWKKYLLRASSEKYPFVKSYEMNEINGIIAIKAELDGTASLRELRVWIPQKTVSDSNYVATAFFDAEINNVHRRIIMLYTPSMPGRLYVASVEVNSQEWVSFERQIESYNWKEPFPIAPEVWKES